MPLDHAAASSLTDAQTAVLRESLLANYMKHWTVISEADLAEHISLRYEQFRDALVPWALGVTDGSFGVMLEVGAGTGSSTCALAPHASHVHTYEICPASVATAKDRARCLNIANITHEQELFGPDCTFVRAGRLADTILLCATLEHMTLDECLSVLRTAWQALRPGGILIVAETPNRLAPLDTHTSELPFFQSLPIELRALYADRSPRTGFADCQPMFARDRESLVRWGCGVSYHEFEVAIGPEIHSCIVRDGGERDIAPMNPRVSGDDFLPRAFGALNVKANIAFARQWLNFIARKP